MTAPSAKTNWANSSWPGLNWKEIQNLSEQTAPLLEGLFLERITIPSRPRYPQGYLKGEWSLRFRGRRAEQTLVFSVRAKHPYFALYPERGPQSATHATRSPFDLALSKHLKDLKLVRLWSLPRERALALDFELEMRLILFLIPSLPEALLVRAEPLEQSHWSVIARTRTIRTDAEKAIYFEVPQGLRAPENLSIREEFKTSEKALAHLEALLEKEAYFLRRQDAEKLLREKTALANVRIRQNEVSLQEALREADWQRSGNLLKAAIGTTSEDPVALREVLDYETGEKVQVNCNPTLTLREQIEKFYLNARRKQRRISEAQRRIELFREGLVHYDREHQNLISLEQEKPDWRGLEKIEKALGIAGAVQASTPERGNRRSSRWLGKTFTSKDGLVIYVGRSRDENLELTFKHARGNDVWMHVRGKPGAHVLIPVQSGKSVPLETLLDAAQLTVYYSGGENWGKTEVDYTFKKYVKRIKDSTEASYVQNKTLMIQPDPSRLKRLLGKADESGSEKS